MTKSALFEYIKRIKGLILLSLHARIRPMISVFGRLQTIVEQMPNDKKCMIRVLRPGIKGLTLLSLHALLHNTLQ